MIHLSLLPSPQPSAWNIMSEQASQMPDIFVPCLISLYSISHEFSPPIQPNCHTRGFTTMQGSFSSLKFFTCIPLTWAALPNHPPKFCYFFRNQLTLSLFQKLFPAAIPAHPGQPLSSTNDSDLSYLALGIPSCYSGGNQDSERERTLSRTQDIFSARTIYYLNSSVQSINPPTSQHICPVSSCTL